MQTVNKALVGIQNEKKKTFKKIALLLGVVQILVTRQALTIEKEHIYELKHQQVFNAR